MKSRLEMSRDFYSSTLFLDGNRKIIKKSLVHNSSRFYLSQPNFRKTIQWKLRIYILKTVQILLIKDFH